MIRQEEAELIEARGLDIELVARLGIESSFRHGGEGGNWIVIPYREAGRVVNRKYRSIGDAKGFSQDPGGKQIFWNVDVIGGDEGLAALPLVVTEGEFDAMSAIQAGFVRSVSVPNGAPPQAMADEPTQRYVYLDNAAALGAVREIILAVDNDDPGANLLNDLALRLGKARCKWVQYPLRGRESAERCKDLNEVLMRYGVLGVTKTLAQAQWMRVEGVYRLSELPPLPEPRAHDPGITGLSQHYRLRLGDFAVVTGLPSHGKSALVTDIACRMASNYGWGTAFASFEQTPQRDHRRALRTWYNGKYEIYQDAEEKNVADEWIDRNFVFLVPDEDDDVTLGWVLERAAAAVLRHGVKMVVVDPWNEMDHLRPRDMTETEYTGFAIKQFKKFARKHNVHFVLIAHPAKQHKDESGKIPIPTLYDVSGCHSDDTEVLTRGGWVRHECLRLGDEVACFDLKTETLRWARPTEIKRYEHKGRMVRFKGPSIDICVTPKHRMVVRPWWQDKSYWSPGTAKTRRWLKGWSFVAADELPEALLLLPLAASMEGGAEPKKIELDGGYEIEDFLRVLGWWITEGCFMSRGASISQSIKSPAYYDMTSTLGGLGLGGSVTLSEPKNPKWETTARLYIGKKVAPELIGFLKEHCGRGAINKRIPDMVWELSARLKEILLEALIDGDGHRHKGRDTASFATTSSRLRDGVHRLAVEVGHPCTWSEKTGTPKHHSASWAISIGRPSRRRITLQKSRHVSTEEYDGPVWCLVVPTGAYVTRRNGKTAITGNSSHYYNKSDVGVIVYRVDDEKTLIRVAKSRYHTEIGVPGDVAVRFDQQRAQYDGYGL